MTRRRVESFIILEIAVSPVVHLKCAVEYHKRRFSGSRRVNLAIYLEKWREYHRHRTYGNCDGL